MFASSFGIAGSGAIAQDQAEPIALEQVPSDTQETPTAPEVRFVASETVQTLPPVDTTGPDIDIEAASLTQLVAAVDTGGELSREMMCLAQAIYFESRGEPLAGQLAVARVIINRAESAQFPDDYCAVVTQRSQFSFVRGGHIPDPAFGSAAWRDARAIARIAHRDMWDSEAGDALYFHARHVRPRWAGRMTARAVISNHIFYR